MKILVTDGMDKSAIAELKALGHTVDEQFYEEADLIKAIADYNCVVVRSATKVTRAVIEGGKNLKLIIRGGVGTDNIDKVAAKEKGIEVRNTPGASSISVAELVIAMMFGVARALPAATASMKAGKWEKKVFSKRIEIEGKTLGIIGTGRIGAALAKKCKGLGFSKIIGYDAYPEVSRAEGVPMVSLDEVLAKSDYISLHIPASDKPVIGEAEFAKMKDGVVLINCARGGVVDESALLAALNSGKVLGAGIDTWVGEPKPRQDLIDHPNVVCTPHVAAATKEAQGRVGAEVVEIIKEYK
ncbi:D-2-hydroxyacid dehydrogenase [bacterium]|nr:D-2-hydroxyacid dehydrogenase [bacterium]